tara:strand:- start:262 stop:546 length:285 start_codon:yes stop_codon:yes gene_type:complete
MEPIEIESAASSSDDAAASSSSFPSSPKTRECAAYVDEIRKMRAEKARMQREIREIDAEICARISWCTHTWVRKREMCQYADSYNQCSVCGEIQ